MIFHVVKFTSDTTREKTIIPDIWMSINDTLCAMPPLASAEQLAEMTKNPAEPEDGWEMHGVKSLMTFESYARAKDYLQKCKEGLPDDEPRRKRKKPSYLSSYTSLDSDEEQDVSKDPKRVLMHIKVEESDELEMEEMSDIEWIQPDRNQEARISNNKPSPGITNIRKEITPQSASRFKNTDVNCPCNSVCHKAILQILFSIQRQMDNNTRMLQQLLGHRALPVTSLQALPKNFPITLPATQLENLEEVENWLQDDTNFAQTETLSTPESFQDYLLRNGLDKETAELLKGEGITAIILPDISEDDLKDLKLKLGPRKRLMQLKKKMETEKSEETLKSQTPTTSVQLTSHSNSVQSTSHLNSVEPMTLSFSVEPTSYSDDMCNFNDMSNPDDMCTIITPDLILEEESVALKDFSDASINIREWISCHPQGNELMQILDKDICRPCDRQMLVRIVCKKLVQMTGSIYPPSSLKERVAKEIVKTFPLLKSPKGDGHESFYDANSGLGFIAYRLKTIRKTLPPSERKNTKRHQKTPESDSQQSHDSKLLSSEVLKEKITLMKFTLPTEVNKEIIKETLKETFCNRQQEIKDSDLSLKEIFERYPRIKDYKGEMINVDFLEIYPQGNKFLERFSSYYVPRILTYVKTKKPELLTSVSCFDDNMKSLFLLPELLPKANYGKGTKLKNTEKEPKRLVPKPKIIPSPYLIQFVNDPESLPEESSSSETENMQPYLVGALGKEKKFYIKIDNILIPVDENPLRAFDLLFKIHFVLDVSYAKPLDNFYDFVSSCIYEITEPRASSDALNTILINIPTDISPMVSNPTMNFKIYFIEKIISLEEQVVSLKNEVMDVKVMISAVIVSVQKIAEQNSPQRFDDFNQLTTAEEMECFNDKLNDPEVFSTMILFFSSFGGKDAHAATRKIMSVLMSNDLARHYNWIGCRQKKSFQEYKLIIDLVAASVRHIKAHAETSISEIKSWIARWLRYATDRDVGKKKKSAEVEGIVNTNFESVSEN